mmetsp:Transcript_18041/g.30748  ORF Transcript_18041/g.30748 Transcript_18041/m.30748 type:complete len:538 (+) Transcript_18041:285-1898(+)
MFPSKGGFIGAMFEVKDPTTQTIVTKEVLTEILSFRDAMLEISYEDEEGNQASIKDICVKIGQACSTGKNPLTFATDPQGTVNIEQFATDAELLTAVQTGKGGFYLGDGNIIQIDSVFGNTIPTDVEQDDTNGDNNLESATLGLMGVPYQRLNYSRTFIQELETKVGDFAQEFAANSTLINIFMFTEAGLTESFSGDIQDDLALVQVSVMLVAIYTILFMGSFSPIHFRSAAAGITLLCVGLSYAASSGLAYYLGAKSAGIHSILPFLLIGIGADDMFVISSSLDQTNTRDTVENRIKEGMKSAGSSITITSFTNAIAFFLGCTSSLQALSSFCFFAGLGVLMLYFTSITIYASFMVWDLRRQMSKKGDCCGLCCCSEQTMICCKGSCLTTKQKSFPFQGEETDVVVDDDDSKFSNGTQRLLYEKFSKWTTSKWGRIIILSIWVIYFAISCVGLANVDIDFKNTYFISEDAYIMNYLSRQEKYFRSGDAITFYVDSDTLDYTSTETQKKIVNFNQQLLECSGCEQQWVAPNTFSSWY